MRRHRRSCTEKYDAFASPEAGALRDRVLGTDVVNGYTTRDQALAIGDALHLSQGARLLDLGGGRGWPGSLVAGRSGCDLVVCDLPMNALHAAASVLRATAAADRFALVRADGRCLPFPDASFDGVCHTDVLC